MVHRFLDGIRNALTGHWGPPHTGMAELGSSAAPLLTHNVERLGAMTRGQAEAALGATAEEAAAMPQEDGVKLDA